MVDPVSSSSSSFDPIAYIQQINQNIIANNKAAAGTSAAGSSSSSGANGNGSSTNTTSATTANTLGLSSTLLSLLQSTSSSSTNGGVLSTLLGGGGNGVSPSDPLAGVYNALLSTASTTAPIVTALANTQQQQTQTQAQSSPVENVLNSYTSASNAYNQTLLQNAQAVLTDVKNGQAPSLVA